jgi:RHS repeat-associated protein
LLNTNQVVVARYLYDPFGNILSMSGSMADANLYRFSSKEAHSASGLVYYLYRFYESGYQRWLIRDLIGELGGLNMYLFVKNAPTGFYDPLGLDLAPDTPILVWFQEHEWGGWRFPLDFFNPKCPRNCIAEGAACGLRAAMFCSLYEKGVPPPIKTYTYRLCMALYGSTCATQGSWCNDWNKNHGF